MMNLKETINFKALRDRGPSAIEVEGDEVVQLVSRNSEIKVIVNQEYFLQLLSAYNNLLRQTGQKEEKVVEIDLQERMGELEDKFVKIAKLVNEDEENEKDSEWQRGGQKRAGS